ncbi:MAG: hypothetical protein ACREX4_25310, partial [Gammaproteobacteria bacterium]
IHPDQTRSVPSNFGADQARLYRTAQQNRENQITSYFSDTALGLLLSSSQAPSATTRSRIRTNPSP